MSGTEDTLTSAYTPPTHVAIIMDGNGRWAKARTLPRVAGHQRGAEAVRKVVECARQTGISYLTLYAFSSENWKRPEGEVSDLMGLLRLYLRNEVNKLHNNNIRMRFIGERSRLSGDIVRLLDEAELKTSANTGMTLILALSYGGRQEIVQAVQKLAQQVADGVLAAGDIGEEILSNSLYTQGIPDPDLIIRTSGEVRLSNFLLWQSAYSELVFVNTLWPDFGPQDFLAAIQEFHQRDRRFGASSG